MNRKRVLLAVGLIAAVAWLGVHGPRPTRAPNTAGPAEVGAVEPKTPQPAKAASPVRSAPRPAVTAPGPLPPAVASPSRASALPLQAPSAAREAHEAFAAWVRDYLGQARAEERAARLEAGVVLVQARREALAALLPIDPEAVLQLAAPWRWRQALPLAITRELEDVVAGRGDFLVYGAVPLPGRREFIGPILRYATVGGVTYRAHVYGRRRWQITRSNVALHGIALGEDLALHESPLRLLAADEAQARLLAAGDAPATTCPRCGAPTAGRAGATWADFGGQLLSFCCAGHAVSFGGVLAAAEGGVLRLTGRPTEDVPPVSPTWSHGTKTVLFIRVNFPDDPTEPITETEATALMNRVNDFFVEASFNKTALVTTVTPLLTLPQPKLFYTANGPGTLLADARQVAFDAGYPYEDFDLDLVRHVAVPSFNFGGLAAVGGRGLWLQSSGFGVVCHELGHNYGLAHANFWDTTRPPLPANPANDPFDIDSWIGFDSVIGTGKDIEYGDVFDVMGSGGTPAGHFNAYNKLLLQWLPQSAARDAAASGTYRLYAHDAPPLGAGRFYALAVRKDDERSYWLSLRSKWPDNPWLQNGIELHWNGWSRSLGSSELLDTTPGSGAGRTDAALVVGRTFSDEAAQVHLTPVERGGAGGDVWMDVVVNLGAFAGNAAPALDLSVSAVGVSPGQTVTFTADASDSDGDELAYFWDFGDRTFQGAKGQARGATVQKTWATAGEYVVRCEVSDMKGGVASRHVVITVGTPGTFRISGQVFDSTGQPVRGVRVHNGREDDPNTPSAEYVWTYTDSAGRYTLANLPAGTYTNGAFAFGYRVQPFNFERPLTVSGASLSEVNFLAEPLPRVRVETVRHAEEAGAVPGEFAITRTGDLTQPLRVLFTLTGTATADVDYVGWPDSVTQTNVIAVLNGFVTNIYDLNYLELPPGTPSATVQITPLPDTETEGPETVRLNLVLPLQAERRTPTQTNVVDIPGWESLVVNTQPTWFQTLPDYVPAAPAEATLTLADKEPPVLPVVSVTALNPAASENAHDAGVFTFSRTGPTDSALTVGFTVGGTATAGEDYRPLRPEVTIPAGRSFVNVAVEVFDDLFLEGNETVEVTLAASPASGAALAPAGPDQVVALARSASGDAPAAYAVGESRAIVTIVDNDLPTVTLNTPENAPVESGATPGALVVTRTGDLTGPLVVSYLVTGTAGAGVDYVALPGTVTIPAGAPAASFQLTPRDNAQLDAGRLVTVLLSDSPAYNVGWPNSATVTILDDEVPFVTVFASDDQAAEPDDPGEFTIVRSGPVDGVLDVELRLSGTASAGADYAGFGTRVRIPVGAAQTTIAVLPVDDGFREDAETIQLEVLPGARYHVGAPRLATITLGDDDAGRPPAVGFALQQSSGPERRTNVLLSVRVSANPPETTPLSVKYRVTGGTALPNQDYATPVEGELSFAYVDPDSDDPLTNRVQTIALTVLDDALPETNKTVILTLFDPLLISSLETNEIVLGEGDAAVTNLVVITNAEPAFLDTYRFHTYTIQDDDAALVTVSAVAPEAHEAGQQAGRFVFTRAGPTNEAQTIFFHVSGSATSGSDFHPLGSSVTIPAGAASVGLPVEPVDDPIQEYTEAVKLTLYAAPGASLGTPNAATVLIRDNDGTIEFTHTGYTALESAGAATITLRRTTDLSVPATVDYFVTAGTATAGEDFTATNGTVTFAPGEAVQSFTVPLLDNDRVEEDETVRLALLNPSDGRPLGGQNVAQLTIQDDDSEVSFRREQVAVAENSVFGLVELTRTGNVGRGVSVRVSTAGGAAVEGEDYVGVSTRIEFTPGQANRLLTLRPLDDTAFEGNEDLTVTLSEPSAGLALGQLTQTTVVIVDDECLLEFDPPAYSVAEYGGFVTLTVRRRGGTVNPVSVDVLTQDGTAIGGAEDDYEPFRGTVEFRGDEFVVDPAGGGTQFVPGEVAQTLTVAVHDDDLGERDEFFTVELANPRLTAGGGLPGSVGLGSTSWATVTILDNETPGQTDFGFNPGFGANARVRAVALQPDGKIVVGGDFTTLDGVLMGRVGRLHADGYLDRSFNPGLGANGPVHALAVLPNGRLLIGGAFTEFNAQPVRFFTRLKGDGALDEFFSNEAPPNNVVWAVAVDGDGRALLAGDFTAVGQRALGRVARLNPDGSLDVSFDPGAGADGLICALASYDGGTGSQSGGAPAGRPAGQVVIGGEFTSFGGVAARYVARLNADGSLDPTFAVLDPPDAPVRALAVQPDGKIIIGGAFQRLGNTPRAHLARLNADGSLDTTFLVGKVAGPPVAQRISPSGLTGKMPVPLRSAEDFVGQAASLSLAGPPYNGLGPDGDVLSVAVAPDDKMVLGGAFTRFDGTPSERYARLQPDGSFDTAFEASPGANDTVWGVAVQPDTALVIVGDFTRVNDLPRPHIARVHGDEKFSRGLVQFSATVYRAPENAAQATIIVRRTGNTKAACSVAWSTSDDSAVAGEDYQATAGTLCFGPGEVQQTFSVPLLDDDRSEGDETVLLTLSNPQDVDLGRRDRARLVIEDDESAVAFDSDHFTVSEDAELATITVRRSGPATTAFTVDYFVQAGTATAGADFIAESGTLEFGPGQTQARFTVRVLDDAELESPETVELTLANPTGGVGLGSLATATLAIEDDDSRPALYNLTILPSPAGTVSPPSGQYPAGSVQVLTATPARDFEFVRWDGTILSTNNPLVLRLTQDHTLVPRFQVTRLTERFETGDFSALPWVTAGAAPWFIQNETVGGGRYAARSGWLRDGQTSALSLQMTTRSGVGSFDFRVNSEAGWDFLEFFVNGRRVQRWSGTVGWQSFQFAVPAGLTHLEWRYVKDANFASGADAAFLDNLYLPLNVPDDTDPAARLWVTPLPTGAMLISLRGQAERTYVLETSADLVNWLPLGTQVLATGTAFIEDARPQYDAARYYRAVTAP